MPRSRVKTDTALEYILKLDKDLLILQTDLETVYDFSYMISKIRDFAKKHQKARWQPYVQGQPLAEPDNYLKDNFEDNLKALLRLAIDHKDRDQYWYEQLNQDFENDTDHWEYSEAYEMERDHYSSNNRQGPLGSLISSLQGSYVLDGGEGGYRSIRGKFMAMKMQDPVEYLTEMRADVRNFKEHDRGDLTVLANDLKQFLQKYKDWTDYFVPGGLEHAQTNKLTGIGPKARSGFDALTKLESEVRKRAEVWDEEFAKPDAEQGDWYDNQESYNNELYQYSYDNDLYNPLNIIDNAILINGSQKSLKATLMQAKSNLAGLVLKGYAQDWDLALEDLEEANDLNDMIKIVDGILYEYPKDRWESYIEKPGGAYLDENFEGEMEKLERALNEMNRVSKEDRDDTGFSGFDDFYKRIKNAVMGLQAFTFVGKDD